jgi:integrase
LRIRWPRWKRGFRRVPYPQPHCVYRIRAHTRPREEGAPRSTGAPEGADVDLSLVRLPDDWLIFPAPDGQPTEPRHPDSVTKQFTKRADKILGFSIRLHDLRVSHGTWLLDQGTPVHVVAKRLGHDASVLLKVYAKRTQSGDESAAEKIGQMTKSLSIGPT